MWQKELNWPSFVDYPLLSLQICLLACCTASTYTQQKTCQHFPLLVHHYGGIDIKTCMSNNKSASFKHIVS